MEVTTAEETFVWFAGVDWGSEKHQACILDQQGTVVGEQSFSHSGAALAELSDWLLSIAGTANAVAVAIGVPHGPLVDTLTRRDARPGRMSRVAEGLRSFNL